MSSRGEDRGPLVKEEGGIKDWNYGGDEVHPGDGSDLVRTDSENQAERILRDVDPWTAWLYKPHTLVVTLFGAGLLMYVDRPSSSILIFSFVISILSSAQDSKFRGCGFEVIL
jgi:hypothetical protein